MSEKTVHESLFGFRPLACMCRAYTGDEAVHWRPCPASLCERKSHALAHRIATSARDYRYGGFRAWLRWIVRGIPADEGDDLDAEIASLEYDRVVEGQAEQR